MVRPNAILVESDKYRAVAIEGSPLKVSLDVGRSRGRLLRAWRAALEQSTKSCFLRLVVGEVGASMLLRLRIYSGNYTCCVCIFMYCSTSCILVCRFFAADMAKNDVADNAEVLLGCRLESSSPVYY